MSGYAQYAVHILSRVSNIAETVYCTAHSEREAVVMVRVKYLSTHAVAVGAAAEYPSHHFESEIDQGNL